MPKEDIDVKIEYSVSLIWLKVLPTTPGWYLYKPTSQWVWYLYKVHAGSWRQAQDPDEMYATLDKSVKQLEDGWWCGPLSEPPTY